MKNPMRRFLLIFGVAALASYLVITLPFVSEHFVSHLNVGITHLVGWVILLFGGDVIISRDLLSLPGFTVQIVDMCNGLEPTLLLCAAFLAYPAPWRYKLKGMLLGILAIHVVNVVRIIILLYLGVTDGEWFDWAHRYLFDVIMIVSIVLVFMTWLRSIPCYREDEAADA